MNKYRNLFYISVAALIAAGLLYVRAARNDSAISTVETVKDKVIVFYSSNYKRLYARTSGSNTDDMSMLCMEGVSMLKEGRMNSVYIRMQEGSEDPYTSSGMQLKKTLSKGYKYVLIDLSRAQTKHGSKYQIKDHICAPLSMIISKKSSCCDDSLLLAARIKEILNQKCPALPVNVVTVNDRDYNQSIGSMGMTVEAGDAANSYDEARETLKLFCTALLDVVDAER